MSSSNTTQRLTPRTVSSSSSSAAVKQLPEQHFFASSSSTSTTSYSPVTEVPNTYNSTAHKQRHQNRTKEGRRWFPSPRPRYNTDGKKLKQGSSYPYPSGGNRLPFVKRENRKAGAMVEVEAMWGGKTNRENDEGRRRDPLASTNNSKVREKGKGKEKAVEMCSVNGTTAEEFDILLQNAEVDTSHYGGLTSSPRWSGASTGVFEPNRGSKRDVSPESTKPNQTSTRQDLSPDEGLYDFKCEYHQQQQSRGQAQESKINEADIDCARQIEYSFNAPPFLTETFDARIRAAAHPLLVP
ncbi:hypothetical protein ONS95_010363 [Cadophora gregata]|uniref:uncharacterized protein n=1 Tax=Cadophora gregata TaxID=51156 RepID=UPI0026DD0054|nr:uncharacterized protein ONS95_010363 [Cadophora gregata]KAK0122101.1 hypothetical protein ONS95_010363 [Cadophora gregata]KAK0127575.1 hypothetical protein ONS96_007106 [Cadophora gregata f. sp. sojae]